MALDNSKKPETAEQAAALKDDFEASTSNERRPSDATALLPPYSESTLAKEPPANDRLPVHEKWSWPPKVQDNDRRPSNASTLLPPYTETASGQESLPTYEDTSRTPKPRPTLRERERSCGMPASMIHGVLYSGPPPGEAAIQQARLDERAWEKVKLGRGWGRSNSRWNVDGSPLGDWGGPFARQEGKNDGRRRASGKK